MLETVLQEESVQDSLDESNVSTEGDDFYTWEIKNKQRYLVIYIGFSITIRCYSFVYNQYYIAYTYSSRASDATTS